MESSLHVPVCVGVIMDGNRRWAKEKGLPVFLGHKQGYEKLNELIAWSKDRGIKNVIAYAFSTENWKRSKEEVGYLMDLFRAGLRDIEKRAREEEIRILFVGETARFPADIRESMTRIESDTSSHKAATLGVALSYGGRSEIVAAVKELVAAGEPVAEESLARHLWTRNLPDPDLIIRTGGAMRLSNFLLWQAAYAELYFTKTFWPDFTKDEFGRALTFFAETKRNFGV